jgi:hypothetical protein
MLPVSSHPYHVFQRVETLTDIAGGSVRPCTEPFIKDQDPNDPRQPYIGKTFDTVQKIIKTGENEGTAVEETFLGMILCPSQHPGFPTPNAILKQNFQPPKPPVSDFSTSVAGTLLHEMAHVVGRSKKINGRCKLGEQVR